MLEKGVATLHFMKRGIELYDIISYSNTGKSFNSKQLCAPWICLLVRWLYICVAWHWTPTNVVYIYIYIYLIYFHQGCLLYWEKLLVVIVVHIDMLSWNGLIIPGDKIYISSQFEDLILVAHVQRTLDILQSLFNARAQRWLRNVTHFCYWYMCCIRYRVILHRDISIICIILNGIYHNSAQDMG